MVEQLEKEYTLAHTYLEGFPLSALKQASFQPEQGELWHRYTSFGIQKQAHEETKETLQQGEPCLTIRPDTRAGMLTLRICSILRSNICRFVVVVENQPSKLSEVVGSSLDDGGVFLT